MRAAKSWFIENPKWITLIAVTFVVAHFAVTLLYPSASLALFLAIDEIDTARQLVLDLSLGMASVAAMVGGFAGVVVVFGLSSDDDRFREVRITASSSLKRNWSSVVTTPLFAAFIALIAAGVSIGGWPSVALWLLELCMLLAAHGAIRLVLVLSELVRVVHKSDEDALKGNSDEENPISTDDFLGD